MDIRIYLVYTYTYIHTYILLYIHIHVSDVRRWYTGIDIFMVLKKYNNKNKY